jgi:hypothetical protein
MATKLYNEWTIISRPQYITVEDRWYTYVIILRRLSKNFESHALNPPKAFYTKWDATEAGFLLAELWIDERRR